MKPKPISKIRSGMVQLYQELTKSLERAQQLQAACLAHLGDDPVAAAQEDHRLKLPFVFAGYLGVVSELVKEGLTDLETIKGQTIESAGELFERLLMEDLDLQGLRIDTDGT